MAKQTEIPGTEAPKDADIDDALTSWIRAKADQKDAAESTKLKHSVLVGRLAEKGIEKYPYVDHEGKKRVLFVARDPKAKTTAAPKERTKRQSAKAERAQEKREEQAEAAREAVQALQNVARDLGKAIEVSAHSDPFGKTRRALEERP